MITAIDVGTEVAICILPLVLVWPLFMPTKQKVEVVMIFNCRLLGIILTSLHLVYIAEFTASAQPQFTVVKSLLLQQAMIVFYLITTTIPNLKGFLLELSTGFGMLKCISSSAEVHAESHPLRSFDPGSNTTEFAIGIEAVSSSREKIPQEQNCVSVALRPQNVQHETTISRADDTMGVTPDPSRDGSHEMCIKKEMRWEVSRQRR